jgi:hypothetical protein
MNNCDGDRSNDGWQNNDKDDGGNAEIITNIITD